MPPPHRVHPRMWSRSEAGGARFRPDSPARVKSKSGRRGPSRRGRRGRGPRRSARLPFPPRCPRGPGQRIQDPEGRQRVRRFEDRRLEVHDSFRAVHEGQGQYVRTQDPGGGHSRMERGDRHWSLQRCDSERALAGTEPEPILEQLALMKSSTRSRGPTLEEGDLRHGQELTLGPRSDVIQ